jgi:hypothetical protein
MILYSIMLKNIQVLNDYRICMLYITTKDEPRPLGAHVEGDGFKQKVASNAEFEGAARCCRQG